MTCEFNTAGEDDNFDDAAMRMEEKNREAVILVLRRTHAYMDNAERYDDKPCDVGDRLDMTRDEAKLNAERGLCKNADRGVDEAGEETSLSVRGVLPVDSVLPELLGVVEIGRCKSKPPSAPLNDVKLRGGIAENRMGEPNPARTEATSSSLPAQFANESAREATTEAATGGR